MNLAGLPGISIPVGRDSKGLPIGMQTVSYTHLDVYKRQRYKKVKKEAVREMAVEGEKDYGRNYRTKGICG